MLSVFYLDVSDNSRKVGRCHQKECGRRGSVTDRPSPDPGWSSSSSWRPWTSAGKFGSQDSQTGQSIYCLLSFCLVKAKKKVVGGGFCVQCLYKKNPVPTVTLRMKRFWFFLATLQEIALVYSTVTKQLSSTICWWKLWLCEQRSKSIVIVMVSAKMQFRPSWWIASLVELNNKGRVNFFLFLF